MSNKVIKLNTSANPAFAPIVDGVAPLYNTPADLPDANANDGTFARVANVDGAGTRGLYIADNGGWRFIVALASLLFALFLGTNAQAQSPPTNTFGVDFTANNTLGVSAVNHARIRYNSGTNQFEGSLSGGAYAPLGGGVTSVSNSDGTLTIFPITGAVISSINLAHNDAWTGLHTWTINNISPLSLDQPSSRSVTIQNIGNLGGVGFQQSPVLSFVGSQDFTGEAGGPHTYAFDYQFIANSDGTSPRLALFVASQLGTGSAPGAGTETFSFSSTGVFTASSLVANSIVGGGTTYIFGASAFYTSNDGLISLGQAGNRWQVGYFGQDVGQAQTAGISLVNNAVASAGAVNQKWSPAVLFEGRQWNGAASVPVDAYFQVRPTSGNTTAGDLVYLDNYNAGTPFENLSFRHGGYIWGANGAGGPATLSHILLNDGLGTVVYYGSHVLGVGLAIAGFNFNVSGATIAFIDSAAIYPGTDNAFSLGKSGIRWSNAFLAASDIKSISGYTGSDLQTVTAAVQTVTNTTTTAYTLALNNNTSYRIVAECTARDEAGVDFAGLGRVAVFFRQAGGAATQQGTTQPLWGDIHTDPSMNLSIVGSGNNVLIQVTGVLATTIDWVLKVQYQPVSTTL